MQSVKDGKLIEIMSDSDYLYLTPEYLEHPLGSDSHQTDGHKLVSETESWERSLAVMHNSIARSVTKMTLEQSKLFILALSKIPYRSEDGYVKLPKKTIRQLLGVSANNEMWFRDLIEQIGTSSWIKLPRPNNGFKDGALITTAKSDRWNIYIQFNSEFLPLLEHLSKQFTSVYVASMLPFKKKAAFSLYLYLLSWIDTHYLTGERKIYKNELVRAFGLKENDYWVIDPRTKKACFQWSNFEKKCMIPAFEAINENRNTEFKIEGYQKLRNGKYVIGYKIYYRIIHRDMLDINRAIKPDTPEDLENIVFSEDWNKPSSSD